MKKQTTETIKIMVFMAILAALALMFSGCCPTVPSDPNAWKTADNSIMAQVMMEEFVEQRLSSPSTAEFPWQALSVTKIDDRTYEIYSYVDSENAFGGVVRNKYTGVIKQTDKNNWKLLSLDFIR